MRRSDFEPFVVWKQNEKEIIYDGDKRTFSLPAQFHGSKYVAVTPKLSKAGIKPTVCQVKVDNTIELTYEGSEPVLVPKHEHVADVRSCVVQDSLPVSMQDYQYLPLDTFDEEYDYTADVLIDPDNILDKNWKSKFKYLCSEFKEIITPRPARYNGFYGRVWNATSSNDQTLYSKI